MGYRQMDFANHSVDNSVLRRQRIREAIREYAPTVAGIALLFGLGAYAARAGMNYFDAEAKYAARLDHAKTGYVSGISLGQCVKEEVDASGNFLRRMQREALEGAIRARSADDSIAFDMNGMPIRAVSFTGINGDRALLPEPVDGFIGVDGNGNGKLCR